VLNGPGTLDPDYMGEAGVILHNTSNKPFEIKKDMRIAQLIFSKVELPVLLEVDSISKKTRRGEGGFGSTGVYDIEIGTTEYDREVKKQDIFFMRMAVAASYRSNCVRGCKKENGKYCRDEKGFLINQKRKFGCVIVKNDTVVSYGYNAQARGQPLCEEVGCLRDEKNIPSGTQIEVCRAVHAEQMAFNKMLIAGVGSSTKGVIVYVTAEPCDICAKMLADSGIETLVVLKDVYPQNGINIIKTAGINIRFVEEGNIKW